MKKLKLAVIIMVLETTTGTDIQGTAPGFVDVQLYPFVESEGSTGNNLISKNHACHVVKAERRIDVKMKYLQYFFQKLLYLALNATTVNLLKQTNISKKDWAAPVR